MTERRTRAFRPERRKNPPIPPRPENRDSAKLRETGLRRATQGCAIFEPNEVRRIAAIIGDIFGSPVQTHISSTRGSLLRFGEDKYL